MLLTENMFNANSVATAYRKTEDANNAIPMVGPAFFPPQKKMGLDINTIRIHKGKYVQLAASNFDAMPTLRVRGTFTGDSKQMAFFREAMQVNEHDLIELAKISDMNSPFLDDIMSNIYDDTTQLVEGADIVPEIMRMQLLCPKNGEMKIYIDDNGVLYEYNYDPDTTWKQNNYKQVDTDWTDKSAKPFDDVKAAKRQLAKTGVVPRYALMNQTTFDMLGQIDSVRNAVLAQNLTATIDLDDDTIRNIWMKKTQVTPVIYDKVYVDKSTGKPTPFFADGYVTLLPGVVGTTWYGTTPEELAKLGNTNVDVTLVDNRVCVAVKRDYGAPVTITTTVSEIVLPSFEYMDSVYVLKVLGE